jgi:cytochrome c-type biogenesis protein CcmF
MAERAEVRVYRGEDPVGTLYPEKRRYPIQEQPMTEAAIDVGITRDLYVALGEPLGDGSWAVRLYYKPLIRWIWFGPALMALGGLLAASDRRYRRRAPAPRPAVEESAPDTGMATAP